MRQILFALLAALAGVPAAAQTQAPQQPYHFVGLYRDPASHSIEVCRHMVMEHHGLASWAEFAATRQAFNAAHPNQAVMTALLEPTEAAGVFRWMAQMNTGRGTCDFPLYRVWKGETVGVARDQMEALRLDNPGAFKSAPQSVLSWNVQNSRELVRTYGGAQIRYIVVQRGPSQIVLSVQGLNQGSDDVVVRMSGTGRAGSESTQRVRPGNTFRVSLGSATGFVLDVQFPGAPASATPALHDEVTVADFQ